MKARPAIGAGADPGARRCTAGKRGLRSRRRPAGHRPRETKKLAVRRAADRAGRAARRRRRARPRCWGAAGPPGSSRIWSRADGQHALGPSHVVAGRGGSPRRPACPSRRAARSASRRSRRAAAAVIDRRAAPSAPRCRRRKYMYGWPAALPERDQARRRDLGGRVEACRWRAKPRATLSRRVDAELAGSASGRQRPRQGRFDGRRSRRRRRRGRRRSGAAGGGRRPACDPAHGAGAGSRRPGRQVAHRAAPGQGRATLRRAARSTLAYTAVVARSRWRSTWPISGRAAPRRSMSAASAWRSRWAPTGR